MDYEPSPVFAWTRFASERLKSIFHHAATVAIVNLAVLLATPAFAQRDESIQSATIAVVGPMTLVNGQITRDAALFAVDHINR